MRFRVALVLSVCALWSAPSVAQTTTPFIVVAGSGDPDARAVVQGPEAFLVAEVTSSSTNPAAEGVTMYKGKDDSGGWRKGVVFATQFCDNDHATGRWCWNIHSSQLSGGTASDTFQLSGCAGRHLTVFPNAVGDAYCGDDGVLMVQGDIRTTENMQVDGTLTLPYLYYGLTTDAYANLFLNPSTGEMMRSTTSIQALEDRIAALEAKVAALCSAHPGTC